MQRVFLIPVGVFTDKAGGVVPTVFLQRLDHTVPNGYRSAFPGRYKLVGGAVAQGEEPQVALRREMLEEHPAHIVGGRADQSVFDLIRLPMSREFWEFPTSPRPVYDSTVPCYTDSTITCFPLLIGVDPASFLLYRRTATESSPISLTLEDVSNSREEEWVYPVIRGVVLSLLIQGMAVHDRAACKRM